MKRFIFFICCILCVCAFAYMAYRTWTYFKIGRYDADMLCCTLGAFGWGVITFNIVTLQYKWAKYLCK